MARAAVDVAVWMAILLAGCGLASRDFEVARDFQAGGGPPSFTGSFNTATLTGPLSGDVGKISSITLKAARIETTDGQDVSFISDASLSVSAGTILPTAQIAKLTVPAPSGATSVELAIIPKELKPYLQSSNGTITAGIGYSPTPVTARPLRLVLTLHGSLF